MNSSKLKTQLFLHCKQFIDNRLKRVKDGILDIEESLKQESKSSAGDKHETGRAMLQIERENLGKQLLEIEKVFDLLKKITIEEPTGVCRLGSLIYTNHGNYFIGISADKTIIEQIPYYCIALATPIGSQLLGKKTGDFININGNEIEILQVV